MLKPEILHYSQTTRTLLPWKTPFVSGDASASFPDFRKPISEKTRKSARVRHAASKSIKAVAIPTEISTIVKAVVTVQPTVGGVLTHLGLSRGLDDITDVLGKSLLLELVAAELDPDREKVSFIIVGESLKFHVMKRELTGPPGKLGLVWLKFLGLLFCQLVLAQIVKFSVL